MRHRGGPQTAAWSVPLIMATVLTHSYGLMLMRERIETAFLRRFDAVRFRMLFAMVVGTAVLFATILHALEGVAWAAAYVTLGALPDTRSAMLYSLEAMTTYGHDNTFLEPHWRMMGALGPQRRDPVRADDGIPVLGDSKRRTA